MFLSKWSAFKRTQNNMIVIIQQNIIVIYAQYAFSSNYQYTRMMLTIII